MRRERALRVALVVVDCFFALAFIPGGGWSSKTPRWRGGGAYTPRSAFPSAGSP